MGENCDEAEIAKQWFPKKLNQLNEKKKIPLFAFFDVCTVFYFIFVLGST